ncbi:MAG: shikimate kinase [Acidobacteriaceae bacterium]
MQDTQDHHPPSSLPMRIVLTGYMGAGKTTVGRLLAQQLRWPFVDLDDAIVQAEGQSIASLFATIGEAAFRVRETAALARELARAPLVLALGGGAIESETNRALLASAPETQVVFLEAPLEVLLTRCQQQQTQPNATVRPVLADPQRWMQRYTERLPYYRMAHHTLATTGQGPTETVHTLLKLLHFPLQMPSRP